MHTTNLTESTDQPLLTGVETPSKHYYFFTTAFPFQQSSDGCGEILYANSTVLEVFHRMGAPGTRDDMSYCYWWIKV